jgi:methionine synthase II (cobalamin-independent)
VISDKKIVVGVVDHHTLQVERPDQVAAFIREALKNIPQRWSAAGAPGRLAYKDIPRLD